MRKRTLGRGKFSVKSHLPGKVLKFIPASIDMLGKVLKIMPVSENCSDRGNDSGKPNSLTNFYPNAHVHVQRFSPIVNAAM